MKEIKISKLIGIISMIHIILGFIIMGVLVIYMVVEESILVVEESIFPYQFLFMICWLAGLVIFGRSKDTADSYEFRVECYQKYIKSVAETIGSTDRLLDLSDDDLRKIIDNSVEVQAVAKINKELVCLVNLPANIVPLDFLRDSLNKKRQEMKREMIETFFPKEPRAVVFWRKFFYFLIGNRFKLVAC